MGSVGELYWVLYGLWAFYFVRARLERSREQADLLLPLRPPEASQASSWPLTSRFTSLSCITTRCYSCLPAEGATISD